MTPNFIDEEARCCKCGVFGRIASLTEPYCINCYKDLVAPRQVGRMLDPEEVTWNGKGDGHPRMATVRFAKKLIEDEDR